MKFSIVTPNYNSGQFLAETIESVLINLKKGDEYFVIDGGSHDNSVDIIKKYEKHITGWVSCPDNGYADAISKGFARATGDIMAWINSSDLLLDGALDTAREKFIESDVDWIFGDDYYIDETSHVLFRSCGGTSNIEKMMLYGAWTPLQDACFWRSSLYHSVGGINSNIKYAADFDFFLKLSSIGKSEYIPKVFSAYRKHSNQISIGKSTQYKEEKKEISEKFSRNYEKRLSRYYYFAWARVRARIFQRFINSYAEKGTHVSNCKCVR